MGKGDQRRRKVRQDHDDDDDDDDDDGLGERGEGVADDFSQQLGSMIITWQIHGRFTADLRQTLDRSTASS